MISMGAKTTRGSTLPQLSSAVLAAKDINPPDASYVVVVAEAIHESADKSNQYGFPKSHKYAGEVPTMMFQLASNSQKYVAATPA